MEIFKEPLTPAEERICIEKAADGDSNARAVLIEHNLRLVAHIVKKYNQSEKEAEDLISIGTIGLIKAVETFKADKGSRLATYASKCIENEILMYFRCEKKRSREVSLNEPIGTDKEGNEINLIDIIEGESRDFAEMYDEINNIKWLYENIDTVLTGREAYIIKKRYGLYGSKEIPQRELANMLGISRSYVSRIEKKALDKLRRQLKA